MFGVRSRSRSSTHTPVLSVVRLTLTRVGLTLVHVCPTLSRVCLSLTQVWPTLVWACLTLVRVWRVKPSLLSDAVCLMVSLSFFHSYTCSVLGY